MPRSIRNCNPLNIRYSASNNWRGKLPAADRTDPDFEQFTTMTYGFLAAIHLVENYILIHRLNTPSAIITRWAPPSDGNDTDSYIRHVIHLCSTHDVSLGGQEHLSNHDPRLRELIWAMAIIESGAEIHTYRKDLDRAWAQFKPKSPFRKEHRKL